MDMQNKLVIIGLGSNQSALESLRSALLELRRQNELKILKVSRIYESKAQLPSGAPESWNKKYLNAAVLLEVQNFEPFLLLKKLKSLEKKMGRSISASAEKWAPRIIDLDILFVENFALKTLELQIPHPMLVRRAFAIRPAVEVYPKLAGLVSPLPEDYETQISESFFWPEFAVIMNVTPDSFSDGGKFNQKENFLDHARQQLAEGADYLDIGGESTRPGATPIDSAEELRRLKLAFDCIRILRTEGLAFKVSLDSRFFDSIENIVHNHEIDMVNDVSGLKDLRLLKLIKENNLRAVCMHSVTVPADPDILIKSEDPLKEIAVWWNNKEREWADFDLDQDFIFNHIYFDPGFGFGKNTEQSRFLLAHLDHFKAIHQKFFLGYSRKSFLPKTLNRDQATSDATGKLNLAFGQILRVHDVGLQKSALKSTHGI